MEILLMALWLSLTLGIAINFLIYRRLLTGNATSSTLLPTVWFHVNICCINLVLHAVLFLPFVLSYWINPATMLWQADSILCRSFTVVSDVLVTSATCSLLAIFAERLGASKTDLFRKRMFILIVCLTLSSLVVSFIYTLLIPLIRSGYTIQRVPNCPTNIGVIMKIPAIGSLIVINTALMMGVFLYLPHTPAMEISSLQRVILKLCHLVTDVISGCAVFVGVACLPYHFVGFSLVSSLYNSSRLYLRVLILTSNINTAVLLRDILLNETEDERSGSNRRIGYKEDMNTFGI